MRGVGRILVVGVLWAAGCVDDTFDMLPKQSAGAPGTVTAGTGTAAGAPSAGRGGAGRGSGGTGAIGGRGSSGSAALGEGGVGDQPACGPSGCDSHCAPGVFGCIDCHVDDDCPGSKRHCSQTHGCVECRPGGADCPGCESDCTSGERCDDQTYTCQQVCHRDSECTPYRPHCDTGQGVCLECDPSNPQAFCTNGFVCSYFGSCVQCLSNANCADSTLVCASNWTCRACNNTPECNPPNTPAGLYRTCTDGHCVLNTQQP